MKRIIATALAMVVCASALATEVYKCKKADGTTEYSSHPCAGNAEKIVMDGRSPYERKTDAEKIWSVTGIPTAGQSHKCIEAWRPTLKDPDSGRIASDDKPGILITGGPRRVLITEGRARNGFGGMGVQYFVCEVDQAGGIIGDGNPHQDLRSKAEDIEKYSLAIAFPGLK